MKKIYFYLFICITILTLFAGCFSSESSTNYPPSNPAPSPPPPLQNAGQYNSLAVDGNKIYISYMDIINVDLKFARSLDNGVTWDSMIIDNGEQ